MKEAGQDIEGHTGPRSASDHSRLSSFRLEKHTLFLIPINRQCEPDTIYNIEAVGLK